MRKTLLASVLTGLILPAFAYGEQAASISQPTESPENNKEHQIVEAIVPAVPVLSAITHNRLVLWLRFHRVTKAVRKELEIGPLKIRDLRDAEIKVVGTRKIYGETLPYISLKYPKAGKTATARAELANMQASVKDAAGNFAIRIPKRSGRKLVLLYADPEMLHLDLDNISGVESTSYGPSIQFSVSQASISNPVPVLVKKSTPVGNPLSVGEIRFSGENLDFTEISLTFEGENNVLKLAGKVDMPNKFVFGYDLRDRRTFWQEGTFDISALSLKPAPVHNINFGGVTVDLAELAIDKLEISKTDPSSNVLPRAKLSGFRINASTLDYKHSTLRGKLARPITVKEVEAEVTIKNIFEGINLSHEKLTDMDVGLKDITFDGNIGVKLGADSLDIDVHKYTKDQPEDPKVDPETNADATIALKGASITGPADVRIVDLHADLRGPTDKLDGQGSLTVEVEHFSHTLEFDLAKSIPTLSCNGGVKPLRMGVSQLGKVTLNADLAVFAGVPTATGGADSIAFQFNPEYWGQCEWDSKVAAVNVPTVKWNDPYIACCPPKIHWDGVQIGTQPVDIQIHWVAELQPVPGAGAVLFPRIKINKDGLKLCGGHAVMAGGFWTPQIGPNLRDCNGFWCNLPRDLLRGFYGGLEAPIGKFFFLANALVDTVGFFDAGLLDGCTK